MWKSPVTGQKKTVAKATRLIGCVRALPWCFQHGVFPLCLHRPTLQWTRCSFSELHGLHGTHFLKEPKLCENIGQTARFCNPRLRTAHHSVFTMCCLGPQPRWKQGQRTLLHSSGLGLRARVVFPTNECPQPAVQVVPPTPRRPQAQGGEALELDGVCHSPGKVAVPAARLLNGLVSRRGRPGLWGGGASPLRVQRGVVSTI